MCVEYRFGSLTSSTVCVGCGCDSIRTNELELELVGTRLSYLYCKFWQPSRPPDARSRLCTGEHTNHDPSHNNKASSCTINSLQPQASQKESNYSA
jgi:hypothetical protein